MRSLLPLSFLSLSVAALGASSCGDDGEVEPASDVLFLGLMIEAEDVGDSESDIAKALHAAREINEAGGLIIGGKEVRLDVVAKDHRGSAEGGIAAIRELLDEGIQMALGPPWSSIALGEVDDNAPVGKNYPDGAAAFAVSKKFLLVSGSATSSAISSLDDDDYIWRTVPSDALQADRSARLLLARGVRTAAVLHRDEAWGNGLRDAFVDAFDGGVSAGFGGSGGASGEGEVLTSVAYDVSGETIRDLLAYDYESELDRVFAGRPEVIVMATFDEFAQIASSMILGGYLDAYGEKPPILWAADGAFTSDLLTNAPATALALTEGIAASADEDSQGFMRLKASFEAAGLSEIDNFAAGRYDALYALAYAIQSAESARASEVRTHLRAVCNEAPDDVEVGVGEWRRGRDALLDGKGINYDGASGPIEFDQNGDPSKVVFVHWTVVEDDGDYRYKTDVLSADP